MIKFRYELSVNKLPFNINHTNQLFLIGSCFTENIGEKFRRYKFKTHENPHGILFNPYSVVEALQQYLQVTAYTKTNLFHYNEGWHSWQHHSRFSDITPTASINKINNAIVAANKALLSCDCLFITLGSAWVYELTENAIKTPNTTIVANNHKAPANWFTKKLLQPNAIVELFTPILEQLLKVNPKAQIVFTISPVRHLREGAVDNNRSKASLIQAVHTLADTNEQVHYFPAYELVIDDLRDYRFYAEDLVHPNYFATEYVWQKLIESITSSTTQQLMDEIASINAAFQHKPFNETSEAHVHFLQTMKNKISLLLQQHPYLDLTKEYAYFTKDVL